MSLPLDTAGFLRRECPTCERQFKWYANQADGSDDTTTSAIEAPDACYCPYCVTPAPPDAWWTQAQLDYAQALAAAEIMRPMLGDFGADIEQLNQPGGLVRFDVQVPDMPRPDPLSEPDDMVRVDLPCHPEEPLKVDEGWNDEVACLVCGIRYPFDLVRALPDTDTEQESS